MIRDKSRSEFQSNLKQVSFSEKACTVNHSSIAIKAFKSPHTHDARHASAQNIAFLVSMDNHTVLHLGDTDWVLAEPVFKKEKLTEQSIDIAILPYWMLLGKDSKEKVESPIAPKEIIATHIPPNFAEETGKKMQIIYPNIIQFTELNENLKYK